MCIQCQSVPFDSAASDGFAEGLLETLNHAARALSISLGHRTGLFDAMDDGQPRTTTQLADRTGLSERYVREWLGAMTCGGVVEHDREALTYRLPPEHAAFVTRGASPNNLAASMQFIGLMGSVEDRVVEAFRHGRGVPYDAYERFPEVMAEDSGQSVVAALDEHILPLVEGLEDRLESGIDVLDVGCGRGQALLHLARRFPASRFLGWDLLPVQIEHARTVARDSGLTNVRFEALDAGEVDDGEKFDFITTFDAVHDQSRPAEVVGAIRRMLRKGGVYLCQEIKAETAHADNLDHPAGTYIYTISTMHCMSVSLAAGGAGLGAAWGRTACRDLLESAGFGSIEHHELDHDPLNDYWICR